MSSEPRIVVSNVSKCFQIYDKPHHRLLQGLTRGKRSFHREFWALQNVSLEVAAGETIGIVGRNGSGKSTLLQLIAGTLAPTSGTIGISGRVAALLELGSGFNPEFTGRENVILNAAVLGMPPEDLARKFDDIAAFADIGEFIDQPVKTYSSGMMVRLAFAVQAQLEPEILIVDEALAVGDAKFQAKCFERLKKLRDNGTTILFVSHDSEQIVRHCSRALLLDGGKSVISGNPRLVINKYLDILFGVKDRDLLASVEPTGNAAAAPSYNAHVRLDDDVYSSRRGYNEYEYRWGDKAASITDFFIASDGNEFPATFNSGSNVELKFGVKFNVDLIRPIFGFTIKTKDGVTVYGTNTELKAGDVFKNAGEVSSPAIIDASFKCDLSPGDYFISVGVATRNGDVIVPHDRRYDSIHMQVVGSPDYFGLADMKVDLKSIELQ
jgi:lipopolysaccharide transport system ATP-binding protein